MGGRARVEPGRRRPVLVPRYRIRDGRWLAAGALEPKFWSELLVKLGIPEQEIARHDPSTWTELGEHIAAMIATRTRDEWEHVFAGSGACVAPVRSMTVSHRV